MRTMSGLGMGPPIRRRRPPPGGSGALSTCTGQFFEMTSYAERAMKIPPAYAAHNNCGGGVISPSASPIWSMSLGSTGLSPGTGLSRSVRRRRSGSPQNALKGLPADGSPGV